MTADVSKLPRDVEQLRQLVIESNALLIEANKKIVVLEEELRLARSWRYGRSTDAVEDQKQARLFNEAEDGAAKAAETETAEQTVTVAAHERKKAGRRPLPANLPREEIVHDIPEAEKVCACGARLSRIGEEVSEQLEVIPARAKVIRHIRPKYACRACQGVETEGGAVKIAPPAEQLLPRSIATPGLLAYLMVSKFADSLPFYRQERIFARMGVELSRATMCSWAMEIADRLAPILDLMRARIRAGPYVQIDETRLQVLEDLGATSQMWVYRGGDPVSPTVVYAYHPSRSGDVPYVFLDGYRGWVQTDGYAGYEKLGRRDGVVMLGCWAHARRKFVEVTKAAAGGSAAHEALEYIRRLYAVESQAESRGLDWQQLAMERAERSVPALKEFRLWLERLRDQTPPQGLLGKAIAYTLGQWDRLERYVEHGMLRPDNNLAENAIRPFVVGRKNWLFSATSRGAAASAALYSVITTAKANGHEPYWYLRFLFDGLVRARSEAELTALLPQNVEPKALIPAGR
jgi:transposase